MINYVRIGTLVFLLHDIGDITVYLARAVGDTDWKAVKGLCWVLLTTTWLATRLIIFPAWIIWSTG
jgi:ceramide synthetase